MANGWIRTTALPYTQKLPGSSREDLIREIVNEYLRNHPLDKEGLIKVKMTRVAIQADSPVHNAYL